MEINTNERNTILLFLAMMSLYHGPKTGIDCVWSEEVEPKLSMQ